MGRRFHCGIQMDIRKPSLKEEIIMVLIMTIIIIFVYNSAYSAGWSNDPAIQQWFQEAPVRRCCSLADGFEADIYESAQGGVWAIITDDGSPVCWGGDEDDGTQVCRRPLPTEKRFYVPDENIIFSPRNPTGHGVLFLRSDDKVLCYFLPSGA